MSPMRGTTSSRNSETREAYPGFTEFDERKVYVVAHSEGILFFHCFVKIRRRPLCGIGADIGVVLEAQAQQEILFRHGHQVAAFLGAETLHAGGGVDRRLVVGRRPFRRVYSGVRGPGARRSGGAGPSEPGET